MTTAQLNKASKESLLNYISTLQESETKAKEATQNAINIANYFSTIIVAIETLLNKSPFINKEGKFFKKVFWLISNFDLIKATIEEIMSIIKEWRTRIQPLVDQQKPTDGQPLTA